MQETKYYCDVCKKELIGDKVYYIFSITHRFATITKPFPSKVETCSVECILKWIKKKKIMEK